MILPSEIRTFRDRRSGRTIRQLTQYKGHSHHLYFTNPGWWDNGRRLLFGSDRDGRTNLFSVDLETGQITRHTDADMPGAPRATSFLYASVNPLRAEAYFWRGSDLIAIDLASNRERVLYRAPDDFFVNMTNVTADGKTVCSVLFKDLSDQFEVDLLNGYVGFTQYWAARPESRIIAVPVDGGPAQIVWQENYWIGHVNTSPTQPHLLSFCHEGPWEKVDHRIWVLDLRSGQPRPICAAPPGGRVGHEYWHADGIHLGYHGQGPAGTVFGKIRYDDTDRCEVAFPHDTGHIHSNDFSLIVGDAGGVVRLWKWTGDGFDGPRILCEHRSSAHVQQLHVHPRFNADGTRVVFTSDRSGYGQVYEVEVGSWEDLPPITTAR